MARPSAEATSNGLASRQHILEQVKQELESLAKLNNGGVWIKEVDEGYEVQLSSITEDAVPVMLKLQPINVLILRGCDWSAPAFHLLAPCIQLKSLTVMECAITDAHLKVIKEFSTLESLMFEDLAVTGRGLDYISTITSLRDVRIVRCPNIQPGRFTALSQLVDLEYLIVHDCNFSDHDLQSIVHLRKLRMVFLPYTLLTDRSEQTWYALFAWYHAFMEASTLETIDLEGTKISKDTFNRIEARLPFKATAISPDNKSECHLHRIKVR